MSEEKLSIFLLSAAVAALAVFFILTFVYAK